MQFLQISRTDFIFAALVLQESAMRAGEWKAMDPIFLAEVEQNPKPGPYANLVAAARLGGRRTAAHRYVRK